MPDADEFVTWDFKGIKKLIKEYDMIECKLIQTRDDKGNPTYWNPITKLFNKHRCAFVGRIHEVVANTVYPIKKIHTDKMKIDHYKKANSQSLVYETLEWIVLKDKDARSMFYLMREYFFYGEFQKSLDMFEHYIKIAVWRPEIAYALFIRAKCAWQLQMGDKSRAWCLQAISINPDFKEALNDMSIYTGEGQSIYWKRYATMATNNDVIFVNNTI
jgi:tetratricopeptide (TPR) repeat protein